MRVGSPPRAARSSRLVAACGGRRRRVEPRVDGCGLEQGTQHRRGHPRTRSSAPARVGAFNELGSRSQAAPPLPPTAVESRSISSVRASYPSYAASEHSLRPGRPRSRPPGSGRDRPFSHGGRILSGSRNSYYYTIINPRGYRRRTALPRFPWSRRAIRHN